MAPKKKKKCSCGSMNCEYCAGMTPEQSAEFERTALESLGGKA